METESEQVEEKAIANKEKESAIQLHISQLKELADKKQFGDFWANVKEVNSLINKTLSLSKEFKNAIRDELGQICDDAKEKQAEHKEKQAISSAIMRHSLDTMISEALAFPADNDGLRKSMDKLDLVLKLLKEGGVTDSGETISGNDMTHEDKDFCWEKWKDARTDITMRRAEVKANNYEKISMLIAPIAELAKEGDPYRAKDAIKEIRQAMKGLIFEDYHYEEINALLTENWDRSMNRIGSIKQEKEEKHKKWRSDMEARVVYHQNQIEKNLGYISRLEEQVKDLEEKLTNPKTVSVHEKIEGWIQEKKLNIQEVLEINASLESKIKDIQGKLEE